MTYSTRTLASDNQWTVLLGDDTDTSPIIAFTLKTLLPGEKYKELRESISLSLIERDATQQSLKSMHQAINRTGLRTGHVPAETHRSALDILQDSERIEMKNRTAYSQPHWEKLYWPNPVNKEHPRSQYNATNFPYTEADRIVSKKTPITTAGSCFIQQISNALKESGYNYVMTEENAYS